MQSLQTAKIFLLYFHTKSVLSRRCVCVCVVPQKLVNIFSDINFLSHHLVLTRFDTHTHTHI